MIILGFWLGLNILGFCLIVAMAMSGSMWAPLIYPVIDDYLTNEWSLSEWGEKLIKVLFTILFAPALIAYFSLLTIITICMVAAYSLFKKD